MDNNYIRKLRNGNENAQIEFYKHYRPKLYRYCFQLLGNRHDAEDTVHETCMRIFNGVENLQSDAAFRSWVYTIARNEALKLIRRKGLIVLSEKDSLPDSGCIDQQIESYDVEEIIRSEIDTLKPEYREIILLREYHQLSYEEISVVLNTSVSLVKTRLFRARKHLHEKLLHYFNEG